MKPLNRSLSLLLVLLLSACTSMKSPLVKPATSTEQTADDETAAAAEDNPNLPRLELTPQIVYGVLASEIAAQRGAAGSSAATYLDLAARPATRVWRSVQPNLPCSPASSRMRPMRWRCGWSWIPARRFRASSCSSPCCVPASWQKASRWWKTCSSANRSARGHLCAAGRLTARQNDKQAAYALVKRLASQYPDLPEARFAVIAVAAEVNDDATIQREFDRLAQIAPKWDLPVAWQTDRLRRIRLGQAIDFLQQELARRPDAGLELRMAYPRLLVGAKRFPKPAAFEALLKQNPDNRTCSMPPVCWPISCAIWRCRSAPDAALQQRHPEPTSSASAWGRLPKTARTRRRAAMV
jgi:hypothetical protein